MSSDPGAAEGYVPLRWVEEANAERDRLMVENARLREALTYIADETNMVRSAPVSGERYIDTGYAARHAKAALASDEENHSDA